QVSNGAWPQQGQHACRPRRKGRRSTPPRRAPPPHAPSAAPRTTGRTTATSHARTHPREATPKPPTYTAPQDRVQPITAAHTTQLTLPPTPLPQKNPTSAPTDPAPQPTPGAGPHTPTRPAPTDPTHSAHRYRTHTGSAGGKRPNQTPQPAQGPRPSRTRIR